jgi:hypothetical protein
LRETFHLGIADANELTIIYGFRGQVQGDALALGIIFDEPVCLFLIEPELPEIIDLV